MTRVLGNDFKPLARLSPSYMYLPYLMGRDKSPYIGQVENEQGIQTPKMQSTFPALCKVGAQCTSLPGILGHESIITLLLRLPGINFSALFTQYKVTLSQDNEPVGVLCYKFLITA